MTSLAPRLVRRLRRAVKRSAKFVRREIKRGRRKGSSVWIRRLRGQQPIPPPHAYKVKVVLAYARRFDVHLLVETGTLRGDMVEGTRNKFEHVWSIELDEALHHAAAERFASAPNVSVVQGDSAVMLPPIAREETRPIEFWLDGHWSGGVTARGDVDTPVNAELAAILARDNVNDVILIDDARLFGAGDYPSVSQVTSMIRSARPDWTVENRDDIIRAHRPG